ncbi:MAG: WYL domain-containing protein [Gammaproteobacteria bacterium]|nr:WYL domain-containing protein [Gammaproteobacteria bacterium]
MDHQGRIYALHAVLKESRYPVSTARLCAELDCSTATVRRIIQQMRDEFNAPIASSRQNGGYWYAEKERERYELPGLWFNPGELLALTACLELLREIEPGVLERRIAPLRRRVAAILESKCAGIRDEVRRIRILDLAARLKRPETFRTVSEAVLSRHRLTFRYHARVNDECSQRDVSPQRLTHYRDNWYLDAWDHARSALRIFSLDRIAAPRILPEAARNISDARLDRELAAGYGIFAGKAGHIAVLRFTAERARWVADEQWHPEQKGRFLADGRYELRLPCADTREIMMDILKYGPDVEVVSPALLRREAACRLARAAAQYDPGNLLPHTREVGFCDNEESKLDSMKGGEWSP